MRSYKVLKNQTFKKGEYSIVPIRFEDRFKIREWRNQQMYHLRQVKPLSEKDQEDYFSKVVAELFEENKPKQILFSYLEGEKCIGYGGLVHINWIDRNAEISFIMDTRLEKVFFVHHWSNFLAMLEKVAFEELKLFKIFTYAFDLRPQLYQALDEAGFGLDANLKDHCFFDGEFINVKIHSKFNKEKEIRKVEIGDLELTHKWVNDSMVRKYSFSQSKISRKEHAIWFLNTLENPNKEYYILEVNGKAAGSIRFDIEQDEKTAKINYLLDPIFFGKGLGTYLLENGISTFQRDRPSIEKVFGYVLKENLASVRIFEKLFFKEVFKDSSELKFEKVIK